MLLVMPTEAAAARAAVEAETAGPGRPAKVTCAAGTVDLLATDAVVRTSRMRALMAQSAAPCCALPAPVAGPALGCTWPGGAPCMKPMTQLRSSGAPDHLTTVIGPAAAVELVSTQDQHPPWEAAAAPLHHSTPASQAACRKRMERVCRCDAAVLSKPESHSQVAVDT